MKKVIFMGTPEFATPSLNQLIDDPEIEVIAVVTQPDRKVGRKKVLTPTPVKQVALENGLEVFQPEKISKDEKFTTFIEKCPVDLIVTAAYGQFLPERILKQPQFGAINIHASLLPKYRGGAPVHYAIWKGEKETGITIMQMIKQMDAGDIFAQATIPIAPEDTVETMFTRLSHLGAELLKTTLPKIFNHEIQPVPQDESQATFSPNIQREEESIDWCQSAEDIHNQVRAFNSWPVAYTHYKGERWKIWSTQIIQNETTTKAPGTIEKFEKNPAALWVATGDGKILALTEIQPIGKKKMTIKSFMNGGARQFDSNIPFTNEAI